MLPHITTIVIDPTQLSQEGKTQRLACSLLFFNSEFKDLERFIKNKTYSLAVSDTEQVDITFTHTLIRGYKQRGRESDLDWYQYDKSTDSFIENKHRQHAWRHRNRQNDRFYVMANGKPLFKGAFGHIYTCIATIEHDPKQPQAFIIDTKHARYIKMQSIYVNDDSNKSIVKFMENCHREYNYANMQHDIHGKAPIFIHDRENNIWYSFYVTKNVGYSLEFEFFKMNDPEFTSNLRTAANKFQLASDILLALHRLNVIHRDIKPPNITRDTDGHVKFIDFGLAVNRKDSISDTLAGSATYIAPELFNNITKVYSKKTDAYSAAWVLFELFGGNPKDPAISLNENNAWKMMQTRSTQSSYEQSLDRCAASLFSASTDISEEHKEKVKNALYSMLAYDDSTPTDNRSGRHVLYENGSFTLIPLIRLFKSLLLEVKLKELDDSEHDSLVSTALIDANKEIFLQQTEITRRANNLRLTCEYLIQFSQQIIQQLESRQSEIKNTNHFQVYLDAFIKALNIRALDGAKTINDIRERVTKIITTFQQNQAALYTIKKETKQRLIAMKTRYSFIKDPTQISKIDKDWDREREQHKLAKNAIKRRAEHLISFDEVTNLALKQNKDLEKIRHSMAENSDPVVSLIKSFANKMYDYLSEYKTYSNDYIFISIFNRHGAAGRERAHRYQMQWSNYKVMALNDYQSELRCIKQDPTTIQLSALKLSLTSLQIAMRDDLICDVNGGGWSAHSLRSYLLSYYNRLEAVLTFLEEIKTDTDLEKHIKNKHATLQFSDATPSSTKDMLHMKRLFVDQQARRRKP